MIDLSSEDYTYTNLKVNEIKRMLKKIKPDIIELTPKDKTGEKAYKNMKKADREKLIAKLTAEMKQAAKMLEFEHAAYLRDRINKLRGN